MMSSQEALLWIERGILFALIWQNAELLKIRNSFSSEGVWTWSVLQQDYPLWCRPFLGFFFKDSHFLKLLQFRNALSWIGFAGSWLPFWDPGLALNISGPAIAFLFLFLAFSQILISARWQGQFNGASDGLCFSILASMSLAEIFPNSLFIRNGCLIYLAVLLTLSYFCAGLSKCHRTWWQGKTLQNFLKSDLYSVPQFWKIRAQSSVLMKLFSWIVLLFELSFPLIWIFPHFLHIWIFFAFSFHLGVFALFGLNRFFWTWLAAYPALLFLLTPK